VSDEEQVVCLDCPERGPQPLSNFYVNGEGYRFKHCKACQIKRNNRERNLRYCENCKRRLSNPKHDKCWVCRQETQICETPGCERKTSANKPICRKCRSRNASEEPRGPGAGFCKVCFGISDCRPRVGLCRCGQAFREEIIERPSVIGSALGASI
jgi:hypothetical protein